MKGLWLLALSASLLAGCSDNKATGRMYIDPMSLDGVTELSTSGLLSKSGSWQTVNAGTHTFNVSCKEEPSSKAKVGIPVSANDSWRVEFIPCGVRALKNEQIPEALRDSAS